ncbi:hypothetical protein [Nocardioides sp.]|uniref:hypothetical protein n=1 Tax=Nocardioides sp. TaxID=35761 RepID=UPI0035295FAA
MHRGIRDRSVRRAASWLLAAALTGGALSACSGSDDAPEPRPTPDRGTPLAEVDTVHLAIARAPFCEAVDGAAVTRALDGDARSESAYAPGDRVKLGPHLKDVAHEYGCVFKGAAKAEARAWVFAPPVTRPQARTMIAGAVPKGCRALADAPALGKPSTASWCVDRGTKTAAAPATVTFSGLFGDAWLTCSVRAKKVAEDDLVDRAGRWCTAVVAAVEAEPAAG